MKTSGMFYSDRIGWIRLFGLGVGWKDVTIHKLLFSERNGHKRGLRIGCWFIKTLPRLTKNSFLSIN